MAARYTLLLAFVLVAAPAPASAAAPPPCPDARFLVDQTLVPGSALPFDAIVIDDAGNVTIASGCPPTRARVTRRAHSSTIRARWATCGELRGVRLTAKVDDPECATLDAAFNAHGTRRERFAALASTAATAA